MLEAEARRRKPDGVKFEAVVFSAASPEGVELQIPLPPPPQSPPAA